MAKLVVLFWDPKVVKKAVETLVEERDDVIIVGVMSIKDAIDKIVSYKGEVIIVANGGKVGEIVPIVSAISAIVGYMVGAGMIEEACLKKNWSVVEMEM